MLVCWFLGCPHDIPIKNPVEFSLSVGKTIPYRNGKYTAYEDADEGTVYGIVLPTSWHDIVGYIYIYIHIF